jgi:6-pyruvoyltetrahydropterin/6-carboxytetrahydropterin synthase
MPHRITRTHEIDAGHRVTGHGGKCAHLHGHRYRFALTCEAAELDAIGMVIDFAVIKDKLCAWLDKAWDHHFLLWVHDPIIDQMRDIDPFGVVGVPFNPTAENMAEFLVEIVAPDILRGTNVRMVQCTVHETAKCSATYVLSK